MVSLALTPPTGSSDTRSTNVSSSMALGKGCGTCRRVGSPVSFKLRAQGSRLNTAKTH